MESQYRDEIQFLKIGGSREETMFKLFLSGQEVMRIYEFLEAIKDNNVKIGNIVYF